MKSEKIAIFIDGLNLYDSAKALGFEIDFKRLLDHFSARGSLVRAFYYTTFVEDEFHTGRPLIDWLDYNGYAVRAKPAKTCDDGRRRKIKRNITIELAVEALEIAKRVDQIVLFSGDGEFRVLVEALQHSGVHVTVVSTMRSKPPMIADELRRQTDLFIELADIRTSISRLLEVTSRLSA